MKYDFENRPEFDRDFEQEVETLLLDLRGEKEYDESHLIRSISLPIRICLENLVTAT